MNKFIPYKKYSGQENMVIDSQLLDHCIQDPAEITLRLYGWEKPTLTIGRNQPLKSINQEFCKQNNIDIVKRPTGGRAVLHDNELTYSFICPIDFLKDGKSVINSYKEISEALILAFKDFGIELELSENKKLCTQNTYCMALSTRADLSYKGKKFIGSAQCRKQNCLLQHGSIIIDINNELIQGVFGENNLTQSQITLNQINSNLDFQIVCDSIKSGFEKKFNLKF